MRDDETMTDAELDHVAGGQTWWEWAKSLFVTETKIDCSVDHCLATVVKG